MISPDHDTHEQRMTVIRSSDSLYLPPWDPVVPQGRLVLTVTGSSCVARPLEEEERITRFRGVRPRSPHPSPRLGSSFTIFR